ncbi:hypothetical protein DFH07DRAFT_772838 [Mycena maculata]|uniref:Uncharacterized protein n=1 Tax=Mycena maculata TaxID=230809 RepID=A0AAD7NEI9_9AGAR|nr:hypothetical protein DFH07DRAFT_772838 [Mycena maculata]
MAGRAVKKNRRELGSGGLGGTSRDSNRAQVEFEGRLRTADLRRVRTLRRHSGKRRLEEDLGRGGQPFDGIKQIIHPAESEFKMNTPASDPTSPVLFTLILHFVTYYPPARAQPVHLTNVVLLQPSSAHGRSTRSLILRRHFIPLTSFHLALADSVDFGLARPAATLKRYGSSARIRPGRLDSTAARGTSFLFSFPPKSRRSNTLTAPTAELARRNVLPHAVASASPNNDLLASFLRLWLAFKLRVPLGTLPTRLTSDVKVQIPRPLPWRTRADSPGGDCKPARDRPHGRNRNRTASPRSVEVPARGRRTLARKTPPTPPVQTPTPRTAPVLRPSRAHPRTQLRHLIPHAAFPYISHPVYRPSLRNRPGARSYHRNRIGDLQTWLEHRQGLWDSEELKRNGEG